MNNGPALQQNWDWRAAGNFIGGGTGCGLMITAAAAAWFRGIDARSAILIATLLVMSGLGLVWLELGRPWRFLNVFRNPRTSWMSRESYLAVALVFLGPLAAWSGSMSATVAAAVVAGLFLYSQARMLRSARGIAAWRIPQIVPLIVSTGLAEGAGALLVLWVLAPGMRAQLPALPLAAFALALLVLRVIAWVYYLRSLAGHAPTMTVQVMETCRLPFNLFGNLLPALLLFTVGLFGLAAPQVAMAAGLCLLLSGWGLKFALVTVAACNQGFALAHSPARGAGQPGPGARPGWGEGPGRNVR